jgi:exopolysaccharide biosynthesis protein
MRLVRALLLSAVLPMGATPAAEVLKAPVAPGISLTQTIVQAGEPGGPRLVHALIVDPAAKGIRLEAGLGNGTVEEGGNGREAVTAQVIRTGAVAGINADFFPWSGDPLGLAVHNGELISERSGGRSAAWGITRDGKAIIGQPVFTGSVIADGDAGRPLATAVIALAGLNRKPAKNELILLSPVYGAKSPDVAATVAVLDAAGQKISLGKPLVTNVVSVTDEPGAVPTRPDGYLLAGTGTAAEWLKAQAAAGKTLTINAGATEAGKDWSRVVEAVSGGPVLLTNGRRSDQLSAMLTDSFSTTMHPRSAVGVTKDGKVLIVAVDGRQTFSRGISLPDLADVMKSLGAVDALNLDGGGSTCLSVMGMVINSPSDGQVRQVADSLLVFDDNAPKPWLVSANGAPPQVKAGEILPRAADAGPERLWGSADGGVFVDQAGRLYGYKGGPAATLALSEDGKALTRQAVNVLPGPAGKIVPTWKNGTLVIAVRDTNNNAVQGQEVEITKPDGTMTEVTTGPDGTVAVRSGFLASETAPAKLTSGVMSVQWPLSK